MLSRPKDTTPEGREGGGWAVTKTNHLSGIHMVRSIRVVGSPSAMVRKICLQAPNINMPRAGPINFSECLREVSAAATHALRQTNGTPTCTLRGGLGVNGVGNRHLSFKEGETSRTSSLVHLRHLESACVCKEALPASIHLHPHFQSR